jgi:hypothetical protein
MLRQAGLGGRRIAAILTAEGHQPLGVAWNPGNVQVLAYRLMAEGMGLDPAPTFRVNVSSPQERSV